MQAATSKNWEKGLSQIIAFTKTENPCDSSCRATKA